MDREPLVEIDDSPKTIVKPSGIEGFGLFASADILAGEIVARYDQPDIWKETTYDVLSDEEKERSWFVMLDRERCITCDKFMKFSYMNHSCKPNCDYVFLTRVIIACKYIFAGEELTINYNREPWPRGVAKPLWMLR